VPNSNEFNQQLLGLSLGHPSDGDDIDDSDMLGAGLDAGKAVMLSSLGGAEGSTRKDHGGDFHNYQQFLGDDINEDEAYGDDFDN
jgi:hypothetical protein